MSQTIILDGTQYVVSKEFADAIQRDLGTLEFEIDKVEKRRLALLSASNKYQLSPSDQKRLASFTHVKNVANAIRVVGAHHDPVKEWGFDGWDAVHGNAHHQECGCVKHYVFDHHSATNHFGHNRVSAERKHHEIEPLNVCETHKAG